MRDELVDCRGLDSSDLTPAKGPGTLGIAGEDDLDARHSSYHTVGFVRATDSSDVAGGHKWWQVCFELGRQSLPPFSLFANHSRHLRLKTLHLSS
jgi:hypothetical protein